MMIARIAYLCCFAPLLLSAEEPASPFRLDWNKNLLTVSGDDLPGETLTIWYIEAYCRPGSTDREWKQTVIGHTTKLVSRAEDGSEIRLRCLLNDGVVVDHTIRAVADGVAFDVTATNPTETASQVHWAQPCIRVDRFTGRTQQTYLTKCFVFLDGKLTFLPTKPWATQARYTPGQVYRLRDVPADDVNPRPVSTLQPNPPLIGCVSADETWLLASAWKPAQELFQGVIVCVHSDFRIGGLAPGEVKRIRGRLWLMRNDTTQLLKRYREAFPAQQRTSGM